MTIKKYMAALTVLIILALSGCGSAQSSSDVKSSPAPAETTAASSLTTAAPAETAESVPEQPAKTELSRELFEEKLDGVAVSLDESKIIQKGSVGGLDLSLTIDLEKWEGNTTPEDMVQLSRLYWQSYPKLYSRFADITGAPRDVTLAIENEGYEIAEAGSDRVHLHDMWLADNPEDYDCIAHELGHIAQNGCTWNDSCLEYSSYTELFADVCRMEYPLDNGYYNDSVWELQTIDGQGSRESSVRFWVWLDYFYSGGDIDMIRRLCEVCFNAHWGTEDWGYAWEEIFSGTELEGKSIDEVWEMYASSEFALLSSSAEKGETSELLEKYNIREKCGK
ncbi:MAG: hypothetical protein IJM75_09360 [Ruminococcus sp.]|nr:hypothetical protein [Ruminococcus sp.]